jgi:hypothetical protein
MSHSYKTLYNNPTGNDTLAFILGVYWDNAFNEDELQKMCDFFAEQKELKEAQQLVLQSLIQKTDEW